jgi:3D domain-containing protein
VRNNPSLSPRRVLCSALLAVLVVAASAAAAFVSPGEAHARASSCPPPIKLPPVKTITRPRWLTGVLITEYFPAPERWFDGRLVRAPGLGGLHPVDWLYGPRGLAMQGEGIGRDGRLYHFAGPYTLTWRDALGRLTYPCVHAPGYWSEGRPAWIGPTWLSRGGTVTYPLSRGGWSNGPPARLDRTTGNATFAPGASLSLAYWHDVAVDPRLIPRGSSIFVRAYCGTPSDGWFTAADTGGAIIGRHIDVFRAPPATPWNSRLLRGEKIFIVPPGFARPASVAC